MMFLFLAMVMVMIWAAVKRWLAYVFLADLGYVASLQHCILFHSYESFNFFSASICTSRFHLLLLLS